MHDLLSQPAIEDGRVFVPVGDGGCGVGCKYCYITSPAGAPRAMPSSQLHRMLKSLTESDTWQPGPEGPILAIGCDTELTITGEMLANAMACLEFARHHRLPVQLATKFPLPEQLREQLEQWPTTQPTPVAFTSITTVQLSRKLEPGAPGPRQRADNFRPHGAGWLSYALIKPFFAFSTEDQEILLELLTRPSRPDGVVVGMRYRRNGSSGGQPPQPHLHPIMPNWTGVPYPGRAHDFLERLRGLGLRVFLSTRCVSAFHNASAHGAFIKQGSPQLCVGCGACP